MKILIVTILMLLPCTQVKLAAHTQRVQMGGHYLDPSDEKPKKERAPMVPIYFDQDDHTFTFNSSLVGETVEVVIDDEVLYTTVVGEDGIVVVPEFISGEVELRLYRGSLVYHVKVEL